MTLTQTCTACGESRAYEELVGDRSDVCWREACRKRRAERTREYHARMERIALQERRIAAEYERADPVSGRVEGYREDI